jgi:GNAT superfamily N-acetyltransferase
MFPLQSAASVAARAFYDDPLFSWLFPTAASRLALLSGTMKAIVGMRVPLGSVVVDDTAAPRLVLAYETPDRRVSFLTELRHLLPTLLFFLPTLFRFGNIREQFRRIFLGFRALAATGARRPREPHFYVSVLTVDPPHQRTGLGGRALRELLLQCDGAKMAAHLETSRAENVGYYEGFGFRVVEQMTLGNCPPIWIMTRPAAPR